MIPRRRFHRIVFVLAAVYNPLWGLYAALDPQWLFRFAGMPPTNQPAIFASLGMVVGVYGILYAEVARVFSKLGLKPRRTIRFVLWSGEEQGLLGSMAYVEQHLAKRPPVTDPELKKLSPFNTWNTRWPITPHATSAPLLNVASRPFNPTSPRSRRAQRGQLLGLVFGHQRTRQLG